MKQQQLLLKRRDFLKLSGALALGLYMIPFVSFGMENLPSQPLKRKFGKINFNVTTLGLGGQAALQLTPEGTDPVAIILKAINLGVNFLDASNLYGYSQLNYAKAFCQLNLIPGEANYDHNLRESLFLNSKSCIRWAKGNYPELDNVFNRTNGEHGGGAIADLKRSLSQMFGDGQGNYPDGAYVDMFMVHNVNTMEEVDVLYKGLETPLNKNENFGALVALRDYRDGTNHTGLNPKHERLIRHLGFSGHSTPAMIELIQRDTFGLLEGMLVPINVNDRLMFNMQHNVIPVAAAKNMAVIGMKVFADGALYGKEPRWSMSTDDVIQTVGSPELPSRPLIQYSLTTPGVHTVIIGIGHIDENPEKCQLVQNLIAAQIAPDGMSPEKRLEAEKLGLLAREGQTNYFQDPNPGMTAPREVEVKKSGSTVNLYWAMAYAGRNAISHYEILKNGELLYKVPHRPLTTKEKMSYTDSNVSGNISYQIVTVDTEGTRKAGEIFTI